MDRGRVSVEQIPDPFGGGPLKALRTDAGTPLRAGTAWLWSQDPKEQPPEYYASMKRLGLNAVRLICFDVWIHDSGYDPEGRLSWSDPGYRETMLARIRRAVDYCSAYGLYAIINYHGNVKVFDLDYALEFWSVVAPAFRDRTHVIFETQNEPLGGAGADVEMLGRLREVYNCAREEAPDTHIMVLTPCGVSAYGAVDGMKKLADRFDELPGEPIDWTKTSVAYHLYHADVGSFPRAEDLRTLHRSYPAWPSENNFPSSVSSRDLGIGEGDSQRSVAYGGDEFITRTCERLGIGWSHWQINGDQLLRNWPILWNDAVKKGYAWKPDPTASAPSPAR